MNVVELGHFALILSLIFSFYQMSVPVWGLKAKNTGLIASARSAALINFGLIIFVFLTLTKAFLTSDFSLALVTSNSHTLKPLLYKLTGVWGNHEGSMVLWMVILTLFGALFAHFNRDQDQKLVTWTLAIQGALCFIFLSFILFTSNPFIRVFPPPVEGFSLNPLLQDPGLAFHPPLLYLGYVGFSIVFAMTVAGLITGQINSKWAKLIRPWATLAWSGLTAGLVLGSWWAYYELGWGGWWFWDPVENAALMPWLTGTALLHSIIVLEKREHLHSWTALLAILTFALSLLGTFLVRSGILTSVHAFASDPTRGVFILMILGVTVGGALAIFALKPPVIKKQAEFNLISRDTGLILNNLFLMTATATVFIGTLYPVFLDALNKTQVSVGPPYYTLTFVPLMIPLCLAMGIGPLTKWRQDEMKALWPKIITLSLLSILSILITGIFVERFSLALIGVAVGAWVSCGAFVYLIENVRAKSVFSKEFLYRLRKQPAPIWAVFLGHLGFGIAVLGMTGSTAWVSERIQLMAPNNTLEIANYTVTFQGVKEGLGPNYNTDMAQLDVRRGDQFITTLTPEKRWYPVAEKDTTEAAIYMTWTHDLYAVIGAPDRDAPDKWIVRIYYNPLVSWMWFGTVLMVSGGLMSLYGQQRRK